MENLGAILKQAGGSFKSVVKTTVLLTDMGDFTIVNAIYGADPTESVPLFCWGWFALLYSCHDSWTCLAFFCIQPACQSLVDQAGSPPLSGSRTTRIAQDSQACVLQQS
jgi:hypothetical protein